MRLSPKNKQALSYAVVGAALFVFLVSSGVMPLASYGGDGLLEYLSADKIDINGVPQWIIYATTNSVASESLNLAAKQDTAESGSKLYARIIEQQCLWDVVVGDYGATGGNVHNVYSWQRKIIGKSNWVCDYDCKQDCEDYAATLPGGRDEYRVIYWPSCRGPVTRECFCALGHHEATVGSPLGNPKSYTKVEAYVVNGAGDKGDVATVYTGKSYATTEWGSLLLESENPKPQGSCQQETVVTNTMLPAKRMEGTEVSYWYAVSAEKYQEYVRFISRFDGYVRSCSDAATGAEALRREMHGDGIISYADIFNHELCLDAVTNYAKGLSESLMKDGGFRASTGGRESFEFSEAGENRGSLGFSVRPDYLRLDAKLKFVVSGNYWLSLTSAMGKPTLECPKGVEAQIGGFSLLNVRVSSTGGDGTFEIYSRCPNGQAANPVSAHVKSGTSEVVELLVTGDSKESTEDIECEVTAVGKGGTAECMYTMSLANWASCGEEWKCQGQNVLHCGITGNYNVVETCSEDEECRMSGGMASCVEKSEEDKDKDGVACTGPLGAVMSAVGFETCGWMDTLWFIICIVFVLFIIIILMRFLG